MYPKQIDSNLSIFLNICRAIAAILVMAGHLRGFFFDTYANLATTDQNIINYFLFFITRIGHECVIVFFVLSGYLVGGNIIIDVLNKQANWQKYIIDRIIRMWTVLLPALLIGFLLDLYRCTQLYDCFQVTPWDIKNVVGNVFFLQTIQVPIFTSNVALWSLANEFWYYLIFPLLLIPASFRIHWIFKSSIIGSVLVVFYWFMPHIIQLFPLWLIGVGIRMFSLPNQFNRIIYMPVLYSAFALSVFYSNTVQSLISNYCVGLTFCLIILYHKENNIIQLSKLKKQATFFADFSFSLYAIHLPIIFLSLAVMHNYTTQNNRITNAGWLEWSLYLILFITIILLAYAFFLISEKHTYKLRNLFYETKKK